MSKKLMIIREYLVRMIIKFIIEDRYIYHNKIIYYGSNKKVIEKEEFLITYIPTSGYK